MEPKSTDLMILVTLFQTLLLTVAMIWPQRTRRALTLLADYLDRRRSAEARGKPTGRAKQPKGTKRTATRPRGPPKKKRARKRDMPDE